MKIDYSALFMSDVPRFLSSESRIVSKKLVKPAITITVTISNRQDGLIEEMALDSQEWNSLDNVPEYQDASFVPSVQAFKPVFP